MSPAGQDQAQSSIDRAEIERFARIAEEWWDPAGRFRPLHRLNPVRLGFVRDRMLRHFRRDAASLTPFAGLSLLDIGCGGGLMAEPMARLGFGVTAIDAEATAIAVAKAHAEAAGLTIDYRYTAAEDIAASGAAFDAVLALEIIEHVADPGLFLATAARLLRPGGALVIATINRTAKAFLFAIIGAEYMLRWLPRGTHHWQKFLRPSELAAGLRPERLVLHEFAGLVYQPWTDRWSIGSDLEVNYLTFATKPSDT